MHICLFKSCYNMFVCIDIFVAAFYRRSPIVPPLIAFNQIFQKEKDMFEEYDFWKTVGLGNILNANNRHYSINCDNLLFRCLEIFQQIRGQKGPGKRCATTPQNKKYQYIIRFQWWWNIIHYWQMEYEQYTLLQKRPQLQKNKWLKITSLMQLSVMKTQPLENSFPWKH